MAAPEQSRTAVLALRTPAEPSTMVVMVSGSIARADIPMLCRQVRALLEGSDVDAVVWDVRDIVEADIVAVDALARLQLTAHRLGCRGQLSRARAELCELLVLTGLSEVLPLQDGLGVDPRGEPEEREEALGVEEERDAGDPAV